jgi:K+-sensing histidine kinase KdpD
MPRQFTPDMIQLLVNDLQSFNTACEANITAHALTGNQVTYHSEPFDIMPELEKTAIHLMPAAEAKQVSLQVHVSHEPVMIQADRSFFQPLFYKLLLKILEHSKEGTVVNIHVTDSDERCIVESIHKHAIMRKKPSGDYFTKYRITNGLPGSGEASKDVLPVYKKLVEDMGGELVYAFNKDRDNYFRLKFPLA